MPSLNPGDSFPALTVTPPGGQALVLPDALSGSYGVVLFYRGSWCPYCNAQLRAFQRAGARLAEAGIRVVALSVDDEATTAEQISRHGLTFPVGHSADAAAISAATGAFVNPHPVYLQSTGFVPPTSWANAATRTRTSGPSDSGAKETEMTNDERGQRPGRHDLGRTITERFRAWLMPTPILSLVTCARCTTTQALSRRLAAEVENNLRCRQCGANLVDVSVADLPASPSRVAGPAAGRAG